jgi:hypothetical protein
MPEFILNDNAPWFAKLDDFTQGYIEAMFFTNCDLGADDDWLANGLGVARLTRKARKSVSADCNRFQSVAPNILFVAINKTPYTLREAGRDFWYTRQGHGVGFWDRDELNPTFGDLVPGMVHGDLAKVSVGDALTKKAEAFGQCYAETWRGWIYIH